VVTPGAAVGVRQNVGGATTARWFGPLVYEVRPPERGSGTGFDHELLLRVEYVPGATWQTTGQLIGHAAEDAPTGRVATRFVLRRGTDAASLDVVRLGHRVAVDLVAGGRRLVRLPMTNAKAEGRVLSFEIRSVRFGKPIVRLRWQNPHSLVIHDYVAGERSLTLLG
jgi:hypothetical protein